MARALVLIAVAVLVAGRAVAQEVCYEWRATAPTGFASRDVPTRSGADFCDQALADWRAYVSDGTSPPYDLWTLGSCSVSGAPTGPGQAITAEITGPLTQYATGSSYAMAECPPPPGCDTDDPQVGSTMSWSGSGMGTASSYCHGLNNCKVEVKQSVGSGGSTVWTGYVTDQNCDSGDPEVADEDLEEGESCTAVGDGEYCASPNSGEGQCGYMNDTYICLSKVKSNECKPLGDGGTVCGASAGTPPAPDDGTRGQPAAPDGTVQSQQGSTTTTHNYYNSTTVSNSSVSTSESAQTGADPSDTGGSPSGNAGDGDGEGEGADWGEGTMDEVDGFGDLTQGFLDRVSASPLLSAVAGLGESVPAGVCPEITETVAYLNTDLTIDAWCTLWPQIASIISAVMLALYAWLGIRILLSA